MVTYGVKYTVGPKDGPATLTYEDCKDKGEGNFECWAPGVRNPRLFVHRANKALFASAIPKG